MMAKDIIKIAVEQKGEKDKSKESLHHNISQADSIMQRTKELHSS
jgi:hypothetical protein